MKKKIVFIFILLSIVLIFQGCGLSESEKKAREYVSYANEYNEQGVLEALLYLNEAIKLDPNYEVAYYNRGQIYVTMATMGGTNADKILDQGCQDLQKSSLLTFGGVPQVEELYFKYCYEWLVSQHNN